MNSVVQTPDAASALAAALAAIPVQPRPGAHFTLGAQPGVGDALLIAALARRLIAKSTGSEERRTLAVLTAS
ncbi:MAG: hypothetical protein KGQ67_09935, partial [Betaproteobacteria bacterium]|nr:hypothetical protein [Betaproteobacteria bacterium]